MDSWRVKYDAGKRQWVVYMKFIAFHDEVDSYHDSRHIAQMRANQLNKGEQPKSD